MLNQKNKFLIIGGNSLIGKYIFNYLSSKNEEVYSTTRNNEININEFYLNLEDIKDFNFSDSIVFFCASVSSIKTCEDNIQFTNLVNVENTNKLINRLNKNNCKIIYFSSHAVFDGKKEYFSENDVTSPICNYGVQKVLVENELKKDPNNMIVRLTKVISKESKFISNWLTNIENNQSIFAFKDLYLSPISLSYIVKNIFKFQDKIIHLSGNKQFSYYEFCIKFIQYFGHDLKLIKPTTSDKNVLFNPKYCTLKSNNLTDINNPLNVEDLFLSL